MATSPKHACSLASTWECERTRRGSSSWGQEIVWADLGDSFAGSGKRRLKSTALRPEEPASLSPSSQEKE